MSGRESMIPEVPSKPPSSANVMQLQYIFFEPRMLLVVGGWWGCIVHSSETR